MLQNTTPDLTRLILTLRSDLQKLLAITAKQETEAYEAWLITSGKKEYRAVSEDTGFLQSLLMAQRGSAGLTRVQHCGTARCARGIFDA